MSQVALSEPFDPTIPLPSATPPVVLEEVGSIEMLVRSPSRFAQLVVEDRVDWQPSTVMLATSLGFYALYGLAMGCFAGGNALWQATLKAPLVMFGTLLVSAPCLMLILSLVGVAITRRQVLAMSAGIAGLSSIVLLACAPLAWLFGVSTRSVPFIALFHTIVWCVALGVGLRLVSHLVPGGFRCCKLLAVWATLFLVVCAQMATYYRPMLGVTVTKEFREGQRTFFLQHFYSTLAGTRPVEVVPDVLEAAPAPILDPTSIPLPSAAPMSN